MPPELTRIVFAAIVATLAVAAPAAAADGDLVKRGENLYGQYCVACHGMNGAGVLQPKPIGAARGRAQGEQNGLGPSLRGVGAEAAHFYLSTGYMPLPHIGVQPRRSKVFLRPGQISALIAYVDSLGSGPPIPTPHPERGDISLGQKTFTDRCAGCHQVVAEGGYVTGAIPPPLEDATPRQIAEAVRIGPNVMPRFSRKSLTAHELDSIIAYVQYAKHPDDRGGWALGHLGPVPEGLVTWFLAAVVLVFTCMTIGKRFGHE